MLPVQEWGCGLPFPVGAAVVAAGGFLVAALWIDTIATELVSIIEYLGLLSGINHTVGLHGSLLGNLALTGAGVKTIWASVGWRLVLNCHRPTALLWLLPQSASCQSGCLTPMCRAYQLSDGGLSQVGQMQSWW